jgi:hypothetical protein
MTVDWGDHARRRFAHTFHESFQDGGSPSALIRIRKFDTDPDIHRRFKKPAGLAHFPRKIDLRDPDSEVYFLSGRQILASPLPITLSPPLTLKEVMAVVPESFRGLDGQRVPDPYPLSIGRLKSAISPIPVFVGLQAHHWPFARRKH